MLVRCVKCGKVIDAADAAAEDQDVECPYCGEKFKRDDAEKLELPASAPKPEKTGSPAPAAEPQPTATPAPEAAPDPKPEPAPEAAASAAAPAAKPKIGIRRPPPAAIKAEAQLRSEVVAHIESRAEKRDRLTRRKLIWTILMWTVTLAILAGIGFGAYVCWQRYENENAKKQILPKPQKQKKTVKKEKKKSPTPEEIAEKERKRAEAAARQEAERKEKERKRAEAERAKKLSMEFERTKASFAGSRLAWWTSMPEEFQPGASDGSLTLAVRSAAGELEYYRITTSNRVATAGRITPSAPPAEIPVKDCLLAAKERGGFFLRDGVTYCAVPGGGRSEWAVPAKGAAAFVPSSECFGAAKAVIKELKMDAGSLAFEVKMHVGRDALTQKVGTVRYGAGLSREDFAKAVKLLVKEVQRRGAPPRQKRKAFRKTVVFYDGTFIAKDRNGITKVPREPPAESGKEYYRWKDLSDEAQRQEREAARIEAENKANMPDPIYLIVGPPTDAEVDRLLKSSTVSFSRK